MELMLKWWEPRGTEDHEDGQRLCNTMGALPPQSLSKGLSGHQGLLGDLPVST